jgi:hypothetical protein
MSESPASPRRSRLVVYLCFGAAVAAAHLALQATGFDDWLDGKPVAVGAVRAIGILFFGFAAFALLFLREEEDGPLRLRDWFYAAFAIVMTIANAALLIGGEDTI